MSANYRDDPTYKFWKGEFSETHLYEKVMPSEFYDKLENVLLNQKKAFKVNLALGYVLYDPVEVTEFYFYPNIANTNVYDKHFVVNSGADARKVVSDIRIRELADGLNYPKSGVKLKAITGFKILIDYRYHALGDSDAVVPDFIQKHHYIINFKKTNNKCVFFNIAYHNQSEPKRLDRLQSSVKDTFKQYCNFKDIKYSLSLYKNFKPIDILNFDELEECFKLNINIYGLDIETNNVECIRPTNSRYEDTINILSHDNHAFYITNIDKVQSKYICSKCSMAFNDCVKLAEHTKTICDQVNIASFVREPTPYLPNRNTIQSLLNKYKMKGASHYIDHFIAFDLEAILAPKNEKHGENTEFYNEHVPVSASISDNLTKEIKCIVSAHPKALVHDMMRYVREIRDKIFEAHVNKFKNLIIKLIDTLGLTMLPGANCEEKIFSKDLSRWINTDLTSSVTEGGKIIYPSLAALLDENSTAFVNKDGTRLLSILMQVPIVGFNSGSYDINLIKIHLFEISHASGKMKVIKNGGYMSISTNHYKFLDIINYVPQVVSLDKYLKTYIGECNCKDKIRCTCGLTKGIFPYQYITSFDVLNETTIPPQSAFYSKLRKTNISDKDYERLQFVWSHYEMKSIKDLLIWYNNLDVKPFILAVEKHRKMFKEFDLDMFFDGVSLPGLSEKIMYQTVMSNLKRPSNRAAPAFDFPESRYLGYIKQDQDAGRDFSMTMQHLEELLQKQKYRCGLCYLPVIEETASADRINNKLGHEDGNILISCIKCNVARKDMSLGLFRHKKLLEYNADRVIYSIDKEESETYHKMKRNIAGGPSIIFNRYAKRNETDIRGGKKCKKVIGYDANALYLWCLGNVMPCGRLTTIEAYPKIIDDIKNDKLFGFLECDFETPEHLKDYFSEMTPIFKNIDIDPSEEVIGSHMFDYNQARGKNMAKKSRKLIGSYFGKQILLYTPLLKWYLSHGMIITETYSFIKATPNKPFEKFMNDVSDARREGDVTIESACSIIKEKLEKNYPDRKELIQIMDRIIKHPDSFRSWDIDVALSKLVGKQYLVEIYYLLEKLKPLAEGEDRAMLADMMKLVGNAAFGRSGVDMAKHREVAYETDKDDITKANEHYTHISKTEFGNDVVELVISKRRIKLNNPIHVSIAIYQLAKLRMLEFYYDCIDFYFDRSDFQYQEMDTDSGYIAFSCENPFEECIKPDLVEHFNKNKYAWFPRDDTLENAAFDRRTPGLFKEEFRCNAMVSLSSKNYICYLSGEIDKETGKEKIKLSAKGVQKSKNSDVLTPENFESVVKNRVTFKGNNAGFRISKETNSIITYSQTKTALNYYYDKRQILEDGISTRPLPI